MGDGADPHGFACAGGEVTCYYKHRHLRAAFCNIPHTAKDASSVSTKVGRCVARLFSQLLLVLLDVDGGSRLKTFRNADVHNWRQRHAV